MKTPYILLFSLLLLTRSAIAQYSSMADSLLNEYQNAKEDTNKIRRINHLINAYMYTDGGKTRGFIEEGLELSQKLKYNKGLNLFNYQKGNYYCAYSLLDSAEIAYTKALEVARNENLRNSEARAMSGIAVSQLERGQLDKAEGNFLQSIEIMEDTGDSLSMAVTMSHLGNIHQKRGHFNLALNYLTKSLRLLEKLPEKFRVADALLVISDIEKSLENDDESLAALEKALKIYEEENDEIYADYARCGIGDILTKKGNFSAAEELLRDVLNRNEEASPSVRAAALMSLSGLYLEMRQFSKSEQTARELIKLATERKETESLIIGYKNLAATYLQSSRASLAFDLLSKAIDLAEKSGSEELLAESYLIRSEAQTAIGNDKEALADFRKHTAINDSLFTRLKSQQIEEQRILFDTENKEREIKTLGLQIDKSNLQKTLFAGGMISAILIAGLLYFGFRQRSKRNKAEYEKEKALIAKELEFKKKELVSQTLHLVNKNTMIQGLQQDLKEIRKTAGEHTKEIGKVIKDLQQENASDANWEVFKSHFAQVHNNFDIKLKQKAPDITDNEIRLAAFLKMKLSTKEIAGMLNVQPESITKSKYRLKKKFSLEAEDDFNVFLEGV